MTPLRILLPCLTIILLIALLDATSLSAQQVSTDPPAQLAVSPSRIEIEVGSQPISQSIRLFNLSDREVDIKLSLATWDLDENNQVRVVAPTEQSLDQWMVINPLRFRIAAGASQTVRFMVRPRVKPTPGEHRAMIFFEEDRGDEVQANKVRVQFRIGVPIYGNVGEVQRAGTLHGIQVEAGSDAVRAGFDISSTGTAHVRLDGQYAIWPASSFPGAKETSTIQHLERADTALPEMLFDAGILPNLPVLAGDRRKLLFESPTDLPPGDYVLDVNAKLGEAPIDLAIPFSIDASGEMTLAEYVADAGPIDSLSP